MVLRGISISIKKRIGTDAVLSRRVSADPYPSTYRPYPGVPTAITNVTIFDVEIGGVRTMICRRAGKFKKVSGK